jgi:hypothetical protein
VARGFHAVIAIRDLVDVCDEGYATNLGWFVVLGERVRGEPDPTLQRVFATAAHRHAWHAELWAQRRPSVPHDTHHELPPPTTIAIGDVVDAYRAHLVAERARLDRLRSAVDPDLDPATVRVVTLIDADLADLHDRLT